MNILKILYINSKIKREKRSIHSTFHSSLAWLSMAFNRKQEVITTSKSLRMQSL